MSEFEIILANLFSNDFTVVITALGIFWIICVVFGFKNYATDKKIEIVTTIGIAFTFFGITLGLLSFQSDDILNSIPNLLSGLSVAFITSFCGVAAALYLKFKTKNFNIGDQKEESKSDNELLQKMSKSLDELNKNLYGEEEGSLIGQLKLSRQEANDNNKKLSDTISEFADKVAKNQTEELINALKIVLEGLEKTIQDKLGESFKEFSKSVDSLVQWQSEYKEIITKTTNELNKVFEVFSRVNKTMSEIKENNKESILLNTKIADLLKIHNIQLKNIEETVEKLNNIPDTFKNLSNNIDNTNKYYTEMAKDIKNNNKELTKSFIDTGNQIESQSKEINKVIVGSLEIFKNQLPKITTELDENFAKISSEFKDKMTTIIDVINKKIDLENSSHNE